MRKAFALLEVLLALSIFCVLIIASSKILLELTSNHIAYSKEQMRQIEVENALLILSKALKYSILSELTPTSLTLFPLNLSLYFSPSFSPFPKQCYTKEIEFVASDFVYSKLDHLVLKVIGKKGNRLEFDREVQCGLFLPLHSAIKFSLSSQNSLLLNSQVLLKDVKQLEFHQENKGVRIILCDCEVFVPWSEF